MSLRRFFPGCRWWAPLLTLLCGWLPVAHGAPAGGGARIDFNRDIRPILSDNCYACHGPDEKKRKGGLRLDRKEDAFRELKSGERAIVAGDPSHSSLVKRLKTKDADELMPPPDSGRKLTDKQIELLTRWVQEGAAWQNHWSFIPPERPALPPVKDVAWSRNDVDRFVLAELEKNGLKPEPEADKATLIRRATLDLTGLPPTIEEVDAFLADGSKNAYDKLVDRLLDSPHYGERMAQNWLDLARYADSNGYHFDGVRFMWLWRDGVIRAFNENQRYDQFTMEQLAGDLLPNATTAQRVASGFMRNGMTNDEGGADPDEYLNKYIVDRVNTFGAVWLGMTVGCTECHDHKYDPMGTREFYRLYAFFHNVPEKGLDRTRVDNPPPRLPVPSSEQAARLTEYEFALRDAEKTFNDKNNELGETQEKWERETNTQPPPAPDTSALLARLAFDGNLELTASSNTTAAATGTYSVTNAPDFSPGRLGKALKLDGKAYAEFGQAVAFDRTNSFSVSAWVRFESDGAVLSKMEKGPGYRGFDLLLGDRKFQVHVIHQWPDDALKVRTKEQFPQNQWLHVVASYDGSGKASGVRIAVNGRARDLDTEKDQLKGGILTGEPFRVGARSGEGLLKAQVDEVRVFGRVLTVDEAAQWTLQGFLGIVGKSRGTRTDEERGELARYYKENLAIDYLRAEEALSKARKAKEDLVSQIPTAMVMAEMDKPRDTFVLVRGDFRNKGEKVTPGTPAFLPPMPEGPANRLGLARWLVAPNHPLTARVTANRWWAMLFGTGLVKTMNDFGSQGEWPSHPELLDWLAVQLREGSTTGPLKAAPWDVKAFVRMLVTSATYRQVASVSKTKLERDPYNRLLSRGPRVRLDAEFVRDNALAVSGLLNRKIGGQSIKPYQPSGIWDGTDARYEQDHGEALYRRGMYVFWKRSAHYPSFATFDAPNREVCTFMRQRTQTPLQSLVLMNDPVYVEAARGLAQRVFREEPNDANRRLVRAFRHTLGRPPQPDELAVLQRTYDQQKSGFASDLKQAESLLKVGESKAPEGVPPAELAAMTAVANVLLNLNEAITK